MCKSLAFTDCKISHNLISSSLVDSINERNTEQKNRFINMRTALECFITITVRFSSLTVRTERVLRSSGLNPIPRKSDHY